MAQQAADSIPPSSKECLNCRTVVDGHFCRACGQPTSTGRLSLRTIWVAGAHQAWDLDHPLMRTLVGLTLLPGEVTAKYVEGERVKYVHPLKYCLFSAGIHVVAINLLPGRLFGFATGLRGSTPAPPNQSFATIAQWTLDHTGPLTVAMMPLLALLLRAMFRNQGRPGDRNLAETTVFCLFVYGHAFLLLTPPLVLGVMATLPGLVLSYLVPFVILSIAASKFYPGKPVNNALLALAAHLAFYIVLSALYAGGFLVFLTLVGPPPTP